MKTILTIFLLTVSVISAQAVVRIVDNNGNKPGGSNVYATFDLALTAASTNDTLLIIPSTASYGTAIISKSITVLGVGFNPDKSGQLTSKFDNIYIYNGISNINVSGVVVTTIYLGYSNSSYTLSNIIIEKNKINFLATVGTVPTLSNILIRQNLFQTSDYTSCIYLGGTTQSNIIVSNNIFTPLSTVAYGISVTSGGVTIDQNLFMGNGAVSYQESFGQLVNCTVTNNIFYGRNPRFSTSSSSVTFNNNLSFGNSNNAFPTGAGITLNNNLTVDPEFESATVGVYDYSKDVRLKSTSPAKGAGNSGGDLGIYGGSTPYKNSGVSVPVVKSLTLPSAIKEGTNTSANIIVNGN